MSYFEQCIVKPGSKIKLADIDPGSKNKTRPDDDAESKTEQNVKRLRELQELLFAEHKRSLLICLQAMDAGGKDGVIRHVLGTMNPQGCRVYSFRQPNSAELDHDYMWRAYRDLPAKGQVAIFNRSYYEDVLVARVHALAPEKTIEQRYEQINAIEKHLTENGTHIIKFFLHISKDEQLKRFKDRLDDPAKHWKISESDYTERKHWDEYMQAFDAMLSRCSTASAPWFVIPSNRKKLRNLAVSEIMVEYLEGLKMQPPAPKVDIASIRKQYHNA